MPPITQQMSDYGLQTEILQALDGLQENEDFSEWKEFDAITKVVDILLKTSNKSVKERYRELIKIRDQLDVAIRLVS